MNKSNVSITFNEEVMKESEAHRKLMEQQENTENAVVSQEGTEVKAQQEDNQKQDALQTVEPDKEQNDRKVDEITESIKAEDNNPSIVVMGEQDTKQKSENSSKKPAATIKEEKKNIEKDAISEEKQDKRPSTITLKGKSDNFKKIIDIALAFERVEEEKKRLGKKNKELTEEKSKAEEEKKILQTALEEEKQLCDQRQNEIDKLKADVEHRNEVIGIVKADKDESSQEFKNALGASLKTFHTDFVELKGMEMSNDVGYAISETLDNVFKILEKNGITIK